MPRKTTARAEKALQVPARDAIAAFVRARREAGGLTQRQLAELVGVGVRLVSEIERGKPTLRMDAVNKVLAAFGYAPRTACGGSRPPTTSSTLAS